jgi:class 3 adenylate cyclase
VIGWLVGIVAAEAVLAAVLTGLWVSARRHAAELQRRLDDSAARRRRQRHPLDRLLPAGRDAVKTVFETAVLVRERGVAGALRSSVEELAGWARVERPDLARLAARDGTVTIAFSDIENSTALNDEIGDRAWVRLLARHERVVRDAVEAQGGHVVKSQGDGFMLAFGSGQQAVDCGVRLQRELSAGTRPPIRVRIGIHRGEAVHRDGDLFGRNVAFAARVAGEANGGEILISETVREVLDESVPLDDGRDAELKGLSGLHRLYAVQWT